MPSSLFRRRCRTHSQHNRSLGRRHDFNFNLENQENFFHLENFQFSRSNDATHCGNPSFKRLQAGLEKQELYYDCYPSENDLDFLQSQLQIFDVMNELKNPKEFKSHLKQMALMAQMLYGSFRQAYCKAKKLKHSVKQNVCFNCGKAGEKLYEKFYGGEMEGHAMLLSVPNNSKSNKQFKDNYGDGVCIKCPRYEERGKEQFCPKCLGAFEDEPDNFKMENDDSDCFKETNLCQEYEKDLQHLSYNDRCAVLKGEMPWPTKLSVKSQASKETNKANSLSSTEVNFSPVCITIPLKLQIDGQNCRTRVLETEIVLESSNGVTQDKSASVKKNPQSKENMSFSFSTLPQFEHGTNFPLETYLKDLEILDNKPVTLLPNSETFHSCLSNSVTSVMKPNTEPGNPTIFDESLVTEMLNVLKTHQNIKNQTKTLLSPPTNLLPPPAPFRDTEIPFPAQGKQSTFVQTPLPNIAQNSDAFKLAVPSTAAALSQYDPSFNNEKLRKDFYVAIEAALENPTAKEALKIVSQSKTFSRNINKQTMENLEEEPLSKTVYTDFTEDTSTASTQALNTMENAKCEITIKPDIPPKPICIPPLPSLAKKPEFSSTSQGNRTSELPVQSSFIPKAPPPPPAAPKQMSIAQQTDVTAVETTGHYKRNEIRFAIQEEMRELLNQNSTKASQKYKPAERADILQAFSELIKFEKFEHTSHKMKQENGLKFIRYLIEGPTTQSLHPLQPETTILDNMRYIIYPKTTLKTDKIKKYNKQTREKILEDLHLLIKPCNGKQLENREVHNYIISDLRFMLETGQETLSPQRPPRMPHDGPDSSRGQQLRQEQQISPVELLTDIAKVLEYHSPGVGPDTSSAQQVQQERQQKSPSEIRNSILADLNNFFEPRTNFQPEQTSLPENSPIKRQTKRENKSRASLSSNEPC